MNPLCRGIRARIGTSFHGRSIRSKLAIILVLTSSVAMLLTASGFVAYELLNFRAGMVSEMVSATGILSAASRAPLSFRDRRAAEENLAILREDPRILQAYIYDADQQFFSRYQRPSLFGSPHVPLAHASGEYFSAVSLTVFRPIVLDGDTIGTISIEASLDDLYARIWRYFAIVCLVLVISLLFALLLAVRLQRVISDPVHALAETARLFASGVSPGVRAEKLPGNANDEIGVLIDSFNEMLGKVETSNASLRSHGEFLEEMVAARTAQLTEVNSELKEELQARQIAEEALRKSEERYALAVGGANDGLWDWDLVTRQIYFSPRWKSMLGCSGEEIGARSSDWLGRIHPIDVERVKAGLTSHCSGVTHEFESEYRILHKDGAYRWVLSRGLAVRDPEGRAVRIAGSQTDITQNKISDTLTGLPNRILFSDRLMGAIEESRRDPASLFAVLFVDLDRFKIVNDSLGHLAGDQLLIAIAQRLKNCLSAVGAVPWPVDSWTVARLGGDEFAVLLERLPSSEQASAVADAILDSLRAPFYLENREVFSGASIGIALGSKAFGSPEDVLRDADTAMYTAKNKGKAQAAIFDTEMGAHAQARLEMERDLRHAIERDELFLDYQPIILLRTGAVTGFEALLRWRHPERGLVPPLHFIPLAEETGLILPIGRWVLAEPCRQMSAWNLQDPGVAHTIAVNLSGKQLLKGALTDHVASVLRQSGLSPGCLHLEVTESILMEDTAGARQILEELKSMGVGLSIDDFGTGYSSLSYLHRLPFDTLKIDRSFVDGLGVAPEGSAIVKTILSLADNLQMHVIAEGIETARQMSLLQLLGCTHGQGYFISRPLSAAAAAAFIQSHRMAPAVEPEFHTTLQPV